MERRLVGCCGYKAIVWRNFNREDIRVVNSSAKLCNLGAIACREDLDKCSLE